MKLAPVRVITLIDPPEPPPYSAVNPLFTTRYSWTSSGESSVRLEPVYSSLLSSPSTEILLLRGRKPPKVKPLSASAGCDPVPLRCGELATPGNNSAKSKELRLSTGRSSILFRSMEDVTEVWLGSMGDGCAETVTWVATPATARTISKCTVVPTSRRTPVCKKGGNRAS